MSRKKAETPPYRHNMSFNLDDKQQANAHEYLMKLGRKQSKKVSELINTLLKQNNIQDVSQLTEKQAEQLMLTGEVSNVMSQMFGNAMANMMQINQLQPDLEGVHREHLPSQQDNHKANVDISDKMKKDDLSETKNKSEESKSSYDEQEEYLEEDDYDDGDSSGINLGLLNSFSE